MLDGKYASSLNTPMGPLNGTITLQCNGNQVQGILEIMGMRNTFQGRKTKENACAFQGNLNTPMGNISYDATCTVMNNQLELAANTNKGNFRIMGKRV